MNENLENQWFYHAVADVILANSFLHSLPEVDSTKIGITGISWGGILTNVITGIDHRFAFAVPVYGCGFLHETPCYRKQLEEHTQESRKFYMENWEPSLYTPLQKLPTLFVAGTNDTHFSLNSLTNTVKTSSSKDKYLRVAYKMVHGHVAGWNPEEIYHFADYVTKNGEAPVTFRIRKNSIKFKGKLSKAVLYYTTDTADWDAESYEWLKTSAQFSNSDKTINVNIPEEAVYYFVNGIDSYGLMYSSLMKRNIK